MEDTRTSARGETADPKDPLARSLVLLGLIPRYPKGASVQELRTALEKRGY